jgi:hypothetical protein
MRLAMRDGGYDALHDAENRFWPPARFRQHYVDNLAALRFRKRRICCGGW